MKKGFTLIELLAVIVVISIVASITMPIVTKLSRNSKQRAYESQIEFVKRKAKEWSAANSTLFVDSDEDYYVSLTTIMNSGFIDQTELNDPRDGKQLTGCVKISYDETYGQYTYTYGEFCTETNNVTINIGASNISSDVRVTTLTKNLGEYDISSYKTLVCSSGAKPLLNGSILTISNVTADTSCTFYTSFSTIGSLDTTINTIYMINDDTLTKNITFDNTKNIVIDLNGKTITGDYLVRSSGNLAIDSTGTPGTLNIKQLAIQGGIANLYSFNLISTGDTAFNCSGGTANIYGRTYISSLYEGWKPAVRVTATVHFKTTSQGNCTADYNDLVSGICVYAAGNAANPSKGNIAIYSENAGVVWIEGGTYYGTADAIYNKSSGDMNVLNATLSSLYKTVYNASTGATNLCGALLTGGSKDIKNNGTGTVNYNSLVVFKDGSNAPVIDNSASGPVASGYLGTCK